jgi:hemerythrin
MKQMMWTSDFSLGMKRLDAAHQAFFDKLEALRDVDDARFGAAFGALVASVEADFQEEDALMDEIDYAGVKVHREQHARILATLHQVNARVMADEIGVGREAVGLLPHWFMLHLSTMDLALALAVEINEDDAALTQEAHRT